MAANIDSKSRGHTSKRNVRYGGLERISQADAAGNGAVEDKIRVSVLAWELFRVLIAKTGEYLKLRWDERVGHIHDQISMAWAAGLYRCTR